MIELAAETLDLLKGVSTATITGILLAKKGMRTRWIAGVRPVSPARCSFVGPAFTLRYVPIREDLDSKAGLHDPDNPMRHAIETIAAGSVFVLDMRGELGCGALGDILVSRLIARGVVGVVADGAMRDVGPLSEMALPVFCAGAAAPPSGNSLLAMDVQRPIGCGGVLVYPGDIVVGDSDGVVVIPRHLADEVAQAGHEKEQIEAWIKQRVQKGAVIPGNYPPNAAVEAAYRQWVQEGRPEPKGE
jgi:regulator of RNase E activity RraA